MRTWLVCLAVALAVGFAPAPFPRHSPPRSRTADLQKLQGKWVLVEYTDDGRKVSPTPTLFMKIAGYRIDGADEREQWGEISPVLVLDATREPRAFDVPGETLSEFGIYKLEGDRLTMCFVSSGSAKDRPGDFRCEPGSMRNLQVWKRMRR
jgi:uncharacterized protein (TIGR03067 family)